MKERLEKRWKEKENSRVNHASVSFLVQKRAIRKEVSALERMRKSALFMYKCPFLQVLYHALFQF